MDIVIAAGEAGWEAAAIQEISSSTVLRLARRCVDVADLLSVADTGLAQAAIVTASLPGLDADAVHRLERGGVHVATLDTDTEQCARVGISRHLHLGSIEHLTRVIGTPDNTAIPSAAPMIAIWGPSGAPGRSTVALGIAAAAAARGTETVLIDADTYGGSLGQALSVLDDVSGLVAACRVANQGRSEQVVDHLIDIDPCLRLLSGVPRSDMWPQVRTGAFERVVARLRQAADLVVVDCGFCLEPGDGGAATARNQTTLQVIADADHIVVVGRPDPVGLARVVRGMHDLVQTRGDVVPTMVLNQMRSSLGWDEREVCSTLHRLTGTYPQLCLPWDQSALDLAMLNGRSPRQAAPSSGFVARMEVLTTHVLSCVDADARLESAVP